MGAESQGGETVAVKTYVPRDVRDDWKEHADELDMTLSEFVRSMVNAGRRGFDIDPETSDSADATPGGGGLEERVIEVLAREGPLEWDDLVGELTGDFEDKLESILDDLQSSNRVKHSGRKGGYALQEDDE